MRDEPDGYQAYLLRLWRVRYQGRWQWRATVDSPHTGERHSFGTLAGLFTFLRDKTRQETPRSAVDGQDVNRGQGGEGDAEGAVERRDAKSEGDEREVVCLMDFPRRHF